MPYYLVLIKSAFERRELVNPDFTDEKVTL